MVTVGQDAFPSFYSRSSGYTSPLRIDNAHEIADMLSVKWQMGLQGSVLIANPLPASQEVEPELIESYILQALAEADKQGISGKAVTPFAEDIATHLEAKAGSQYRPHSSQCIPGADIAVAMGGKSLRIIFRSIKPMTANKLIQLVKNRRSVFPSQFDESKKVDDAIIGI